MSDFYTVVSGSGGDDLPENLAKVPVEPIGLTTSPSGEAQLLCLKADITYQKLQTFALPFVAQAAPTAASRGIFFPAHKQARFYFSPEPTGGVGATFNCTIWHRERGEDGITVSDWVAGATLTATAFTEAFDTSLYHREIFIQVNSYTAGAGAPTSVSLFVAGSSNIMEMTSTTILAADLTAIRWILTNTSATVGVDPAPPEAFQIGVRLTDPTALPADGTVGNLGNVLATLKGILMVYAPHGTAGEDISVASPHGRMLVEERLSVGTQLTASGQLISAGTGVFGNWTVTNAHATDATVVIFYDNTSAAGTIVDRAYVPAGSTVIGRPNVNYGVGVYASISGGTPHVLGRARQG